MEGRHTWRMGPNIYSSISYTTTAVHDMTCHRLDSTRLTRQFVVFRGWIPFVLSVRCGSGNAKNLELSDLSVQGNSGFLLAQGKNCLARGQGRLRNSADMQASLTCLRPQKGAPSISRCRTFCMVCGHHLRVSSLYVPTRDFPSLSVGTPVFVTSICLNGSRLSCPFCNKARHLLVGTMMDPWLSQGLCVGHF